MHDFNAGGTIASMLAADFGTLGEWDEAIVRRALGSGCGYNLGSS